ncbi:MAG: Coenzyme F420 hydrogenase/dehydrogenase, beta subunit C-terminal domain, partial [Peptostreptococcaceae bacterium]
KSGSDITIGDFWGIERVMPEMDDDKGTSLVLMNTQKGKQLISKDSTEIHSVSYNNAIIGNPAMEHSAFLSAKRNSFYSLYSSGENLFVILNRIIPIRVKMRIRESIKDVVIKIGLAPIVRKIIQK